MDLHLPVSRYAYDPPTVEAEYVSGTVRIRITPNPSLASILSHIVFILFWGYWDFHAWKHADWVYCSLGIVGAALGIADLARSFLGFEVVELSPDQISLRKFILFGSQQTYDVSKVTQFGCYEDENEISCLRFKYGRRWVQFARQIRVEDADHALDVIQSAGLTRSIGLADPFGEHFTTLNLNG